MGRAVFVLHSTLTPNAVVESLRGSIDKEQWALFSLSGYRGDLPLLGEVHQNRFRVQKRRNSGNDFAEHFYAKFAAEPGGTRIEGYFDPPARVRYFRLIWLGFAFLFGAPLFVDTLFDVFTGSHHASGDTWVGLVVPPSLILVGIIVPRIARLFGKTDERFILEQVQTTLGARLEEPASH